MEKELAIVIINAVGKYGVPAMIEAIQNLGKDTITNEDIEALGSNMKEPEEYFKRPNKPKPSSAKSRDKIYDGLG